MVGVGRGTLTARARAGLRRHLVFGALLVLAAGQAVRGTALCVPVLEVHLLVGLP